MCGACALGVWGSSSRSLQDVDFIHDRPEVRSAGLWPEDRSSGLGSGRYCVLSGADLGRGASFRGPDAIRCIVSEPRESAQWPTSEPEKRNPIPSHPSAGQSPVERTSGRLWTIRIIDIAHRELPSLPCWRRFHGWRRASRWSMLIVMRSRAPSPARRAVFIE